MKSQDLDDEDLAVKTCLALEFRGSLWNLVIMLNRLSCFRWSCAAPGKLPEMNKITDWGVPGWVLRIFLIVVSQC